MRLKNKVTLITGAGSGIGRDTAILFARHGSHIVINDINEVNAEETLQLILEEGGSGEVVLFDVTNHQQVEEAVRTIVKNNKKVDILFNNAGIPGVGEIHEIDEKFWNKVVDVNINGVFNVSKYVLPYMIEQQEGSIINMSSCVAEIGLAKRALYAATKGAVLSMTKSMQVDYAKYNIKVNALLPGTIYTPFVEQYLKESYDDMEEGLKSVTNRQLTEELGTPEDVAKAALFLASDDAKFVMGSPLYVDGGVVFGKNT